MPAGEKNAHRYALGRLVLDYARAFIWPAMLLVIVFIYKDDVREILENREVEIGGVLKIGQRVRQIEQDAVAEIADIRVLLDTLIKATNTETVDLQPDKVASDIDTKLARLTSNISREIEQIQQPMFAAEQSQLPPTQQPNRAAFSPANLEISGFQALIDKNVGKAIEYFNSARNLYPSYHNVSEIRQLLIDKKDALSDRASAEWAETYRIILAEYSWGMPSEFRPEFRKLAAEAYK